MTRWKRRMDGLMQCEGKIRGGSIGDVRGQVLEQDRKADSRWAGRGN